MSFTKVCGSGFLALLTLSVSANADFGSAPQPVETVVEGAASDSVLPTEAPFSNPIRLPADAPKNSGNHFVDADDPERSIPTYEERLADPLLFGYFMMELADKSKAALDAKNYEQAVKYYRAMIKASPEKAMGWGRLCEAYQALGKLPEAEAACAVGINKNGATIAEHARYVEVLLGNRPGALEPADLQNVDGVIATLQQYPEGELFAAQLECRLGARLEDPMRLRHCVRILREKAPHELLTISYSWALAVAEDDAEAAERELLRATAAGMPGDALERMRQGAARLIKPMPLSPLRWVAPAVVVLLLLGLAFYLAQRRKRSVAHA